MSSICFGNRNFKSGPNEIWYSWSKNIENKDIWKSLIFTFGCRHWFFKAPKCHHLLQVLYPLRQALFSSYPGAAIGNCTTTCLGLKCTSSQALYTSTLTDKILCSLSLKFATPSHLWIPGPMSPDPEALAVPRCALLWLTLALHLTVAVQRCISSSLSFTSRNTYWKPLDCVQAFLPWH
jgi:hypothetical protein